MRKFYAAKIKKFGFFAFVLGVLFSLMPFTNALGQIAQKGIATWASDDYTNYITIAKPTGIANGDVLIANLAYVSTSTLQNASANGWTVIKGFSDGYLRGVVLYKISGNSEPGSYTFNSFRSNGSNVDYVVGSIIAFSGVDGTGGVKENGVSGGPFDVIPNNIYTGSSTTVTATSITTATANAAIILLGQSYRQGSSARTWNSNSWTTTSPGSLNEIMDFQGTSRVSVGAAWKVKSTSGNTGNGAVTLSGSNTNNGGLLIALRPLSTSTATSTVTVVNPNSIVYGTAFTTFTAAVTPDPGSGAVQFKVDGSNVGGPIAVSGGSASLNYSSSALNAGNHNISAVFSGSGSFASSTSSNATLTVTKKPITITGISANNKTYDGNTSATLTGGASSDIINGDAVTYTTNGSFSDKNAGVGKTVNISGVTLGGADAGNYSVSSYPSTSTANITPKPLTAASTVSKVYDATNTAVNVNVGTVTGYVGSETLNITATAADYTNPNVGNNKATTISYILSDGTNGGLASNYSMANKTINTGVITKRPITVTAAINNKVYDGTNSATAIPTVTSGSLAGTDALNFTEVYNNKNAGTGKTLIPSGTVSDGNGGNNYAITLQNNNTGVITKQPITVTATVNTKTYDGNVTATAAPSVSGTIFSGDVGTFTETYDNKNAGSGKTLTPTGAINDGNSGGNYDISFVAINTGVINPKTITVTAVTNTKSYDGNTSAAGVPSVSAGGIQSGDTPGFIETYDNKNAGTGKTLTPSGTVNDGNSGANYSYSYVTNNSAVISPLVLTYEADPVSRVYGTTNPTLSGTVTGFLSGENMGNATTGTLTFTTTATISSAIGSYPITGAGLNANNGNYTFAQAAANPSAFTITKADLSISPDNQTKCAGSAFTFSGTEFTSTGLVNSDAVSSVTLTSAGTAAGALPGSYPIVASAATGTGLGNYNIIYNTGATLTVNARPTAQITSANTAICNPGTTSITGNVTAVGAWTLTLSDGQTTTGSGNGSFTFSVSPTSTTTYTLTSLTDASCTSIASDLTGSTKVNVYEPIVITSQPEASQKVCGSTNTAITFSVNATGDGPTYQWYKNDVAHPITGATSATYTIPNPVANDEAIYFVIVSGLSPCAAVQSDNAELIVNQAITLSPINPLTPTICEDGTATFNVTASGTGLSFFWQHDGNTLSNGGNITIVSDATSSTLTINPVSPGDAGIYHLIVNGDDNVCPQALSNPDATLTVNKKPANPASATASAPVICAGTSTTLTLNGGGGGTGEVIHWYTGPNGTGLAVGTGNNLLVNPGTSTTYYGRYEVGAPCSMNSADAIVTVLVDPVSVGGTAAMANQEVCVGSLPSSDITLSGSVGNIQWQKSTTAGFTSPINIVGAVNPTLTSSQIGTVAATIYIRAKVTSGVCTVAYSNVITITANTLPIVNSVSPVTSCGNDNITLAGTTSAGATIDWYTSATGGTLVGSGLSFTTTISATTTFYAEARNTSTGCISVGRTQLTATYKAKPDANVSVSTQTICSESAIASINITNPNATPGTTFSWTRNNTTNVTGIADGSGTAISGALTNTTNTQQIVTFTITPTANGTCSGTPVTATVIVNPKPSIAITSAPDAVCYTSPILINFNSPNGVGTNFTWTRTNPAGVQAGPVTSGSGNINQTLVNTTNSNITVTYTLTAASTDGCSNSITKNVVLYAQFKSDNFIIGNTQIVCLNSDVDTLRVVNPITGGSGNLSYSWTKNGSPVGTDMDRYKPANPTYGTTDTYALSVTDLEGCGNATSTNVVTVNTALDFSLDVSGLPTEAELCNQEAFSHTIKSQSLIGLFSGDMSFSWKSPDGFISSTTAPNPNTYGERVDFRSFFGLKFGGHFEGTATFKGINSTTHSLNTNIYITPYVESYDFFGIPIGGCNLNTVTVPVTIHPVPKVIATVSSTPICSGVSLNAILKGTITDVATSFSWTSTVTSGSVTGNTSANSGDITAGNTYTLADNIINTGTTQAKVHYKVTPSSNGCTGTPVEFDVFVNPPITSGSISGSTSVCSGEIPIFGQTAATGTGTISYQWQRSTTGCAGTFTNIAGATSANYTPAAGITVQTTYRRIASITTGGTTCSAITNCVTVDVNPLLPVSVSITNTTPLTVCAGDPISFQATPTNGGTNPGYQWYVNSTAVTGANNSTFSSSTLANGDKVSVKITSSDALCSSGMPAASHELTVTVNALKPVSVTVEATSPTTACAGTAISFKANPTNGGTTPVYQWYVNGNPVTGANAATFSSTTLQNNDIVTVGLNSNASPCATGNPATSNGITVTVNPILNVGVSVSADKTNICAGDEVTFTATPTNGGTTPAYQWKLNGTNVGSNSPTYTNSTWSNNDKVICVLTSNASPCAQGSPATSNEVKITIKPNAIPGTIVAPSGGTNLCVGGTTYTYLVTGNNSSGTWSSSDNTVFTVNAAGKVTALQAGQANLIYTVTTDCSTDQTELLLTVGATPANPGPISGNTLACSTNSGNTYSVTNVAGLTYNWSLPTGWTFAGQGTNEITITAVGSSGTISVNAVTSTYVCSASPSSTLAVAVNTPGQWLGTVSSDWNTAANWGCATVPTTTTDVSIPVVTSPNFYPVVQIAPTAMAHNVTIASGASLTVTGQTLQISGAIFNTGIFDATHGTLDFNGAAPQAIEGTMFENKTVENLKVSNDALSISTTGDTLNITGLVSFGTPTAKLNTGSNLTLKSTKDNTASIGELATGNVVTGQVEVERYINIGPGGHAKTWQFLATPTQGASLKNSWMEGIAGVTNTNSTGYGAQFTGTSGTTGYDGTSVAPSVKSWDPSIGNWKELDNTGNQLYNKNGYFAFVRGDRSVSLASQPAKPTTLRSKGTILTGDQSITAPMQEPQNVFFSIGNPYPSAVDMTKVQSKVDTKIEPLQFFYVWNPNGSDGYYNVGRWDSYTYIGGQYITTPGGQVNNMIQSGQAFLMQLDQSNPTDVTFTESAKSSLSDNIAFREQTVGSTSAQLITNLLSVKADGSTQLTDGTLQLFGKGFKAGVDRYDGRKITNSANNFAVKSNGINLVVERRQPLTEQDTIQFNLAGMAKQNFRLEFKAQGLSSQNVEGFVEDTYLDTRTPLNMEGTTNVDFAVTSDNGSYAANRFRIVFKTAVVLPVKFVSVTAVQKDENIQVDWKVENEKAVKQYDVEKSVDGVGYKKAFTVAATNNGAGSYQWLDEQAAPGDNYYRIRMEDQSGKISYSDVVKVSIPLGKPSIGIYPNPITDGIIHLQLVNQPKGRYGLRLLNPLGQTIIAKQVEHAGGNATENIKWDYNLAHGVYQLQVLKPDGKTQVIKVMY